MDYSASLRTEDVVSESVDIKNPNVFFRNELRCSRCSKRVGNCSCPIHIRRRGRMFRVVPNGVIFPAKERRRNG